MGFDLKWDKDDVYIRFYGSLVLQDLLEANGLIYGDIRFDVMIFQIADFTAVECVDLSSEDAKIITTLELRATHWNREVTVVHVTKHPELKHLLGVYKKGMEPTNWSIEIVDTLEEAEKMKK